MSICQLEENISQKRIQNPVEHLRWNILRKYRTAESCQLFLQNPLTLTYDKVLNMPAPKNSVRIVFPALQRSITKRIHCTQELHYQTKVGYELQRLAKLFTSLELKTKNKLLQELHK